MFDQTREQLRDWTGKTWSLDILRSMLADGAAFVSVSVTRDDVTVRETTVTAAEREYWS